MSKVLFSVSYQIKEEERDEYIRIASELKSIIKADGLISYEIFEEKKQNSFCELFQFESEEAFDNYDDTNEMVVLLNEKLSNLIIEKTTSYKTYKNLLD